MSRASKAEWKPSFKAVDGLSRSQATAAAASTALAISPDRALIAELAADLLRGRSKKLAKHIRTTVFEVQASQRFIPAHLTAPEAVASGAESLSLIHDLLSRAADVNIIQAFIDHIIFVPRDRQSETYSPEAHAKRLDRLRADHPALYQSIVEGKLGQATASAPPALKQNRDFALTIRVHAYLLVIRTALDLAQVLRSLACNPTGERFAGGNPWLNTGAVLAATVSAPATIVVDIATNFKTVTPAASFHDTLQEAMARGWLPANADGLALATIAQRVRDRLGSSDASEPLDRIIEAIGEAARTVVFSREELQRRGFARHDFCHYRTGLTTTEAATYLSQVMLRALAIVDQRTGASFPGANLPRCRSMKPAKLEVMAGAAILRADARPDKNAAVRLAELDPEHKAGRKPYKSLQAALSRGDVKKQATASFRIDVDRWFDMLS